MVVSLLPSSHCPGLWLWWCVHLSISLSEARVGFSLLIAAFNSITDLACVGWVWSYVYFIMIGSGTVNLLLLAFLLIVLDRFDLMVSIDRAWLFVSLAFCSLLVSAADLRSELSLAKDKMKMKMSFIVTYFIASLACPAFWLILWISISSCLCLDFLLAPVVYLWLSQLRFSVLDSIVSWYETLIIWLLLLPRSDDRSLQSCGKWSFFLLSTGSGNSVLYYLFAFVPWITVRTACIWPLSWISCNLLSI